MMYKDNALKVFNILKSKKYLLTILIINVLIMAVYLVLKLYVGESLVIKDLYGFMSLFFAEAIITFLYCSIRYFFSDFNRSGLMGKLFWILLLLAFALKATGEILRR